MTIIERDCLRTRPADGPAESRQGPEIALERTASGEITCLVADDHPAVARAACDGLEESGVRIVGEASDGEEALEAIQRLRPKVAVVDAHMPRLSGLDAVRACARVAPETEIVLYTGFSEQALLDEALDAGVRGFVSKSAPLSEIVRAVRLAAEGRAYIDPVLAGSISESAAAKKASGLTKREREVLRMLSDGCSNEVIGKALFISPETVRTHVRKAMVKMDATTRTEAVARALRLEMIA